ncbi:25S rRNA cytosine-C5-methyltransferase rcm1 [Hondaea fermentalgiana]|uniref:25S rRNA cytosine-C5-methyltransferase rcm1 n=1 Tax=Hondaea fermentalgiana TaxID=2315210 RepID=A0A2R5GH30_9STRA|nr:25S rRNA cytosine-C5-methyltransferase rcm1 [Hondaea fermentalgiana]|eukprot:GBG27581.1 25S rRNA cytosine-C5-methyltransferase rcm1 [Hondaea fermentalgiana]
MYRDASRVMEQLLLQQGTRGAKRDAASIAGPGASSRKRARKQPVAKVGLKALALGNNIKNKTKTYAVVCETLKYRDTLDAVLRGAKLAPSQLARSTGLLYVMLYDHLFGKGIKGGGAVKRAIIEQDKALRTSLAEIMREKGAKAPEDLLPAHIRDAPKFPRYARVNEIVASVASVRATLAGAQDEKSTSRKALTLEQDAHIPSLLRFPHGTDLHDHTLVNSGKIILQDKASCLPAEAIRLACARFRQNGAIPFDALDATAAPGNKTSQLAANGFRRVFAFDKSSRRLDLLQRRMKQAHADGIVTATCQDFLSVEPSDKELADVRVILLDPSCSGSGMVGRVDHLLDAAESDPDAEENDATQTDRLENLASFQLECLEHAMSFPQVECISYSTCSVHSVENEGVVAAALKAHPDFVLTRALPSWPTRGVASEGLSAQDAAMLVRADPAKDETSGFFVALFLRKNSTLATLDDAEVKRRKKKNLARKRWRKQARSTTATVDATAETNGTASS